MEAHQERVACLAADVRGDTVFVSHVRQVSPDAADSLGVSATASIEQCGPPEWDGTVHTHAHPIGVRVDVGDRARPPIPHAALRRA